MVLLFTITLETFLSLSEDMFLSEPIGTAIDTVFQKYEVVLTALHP